MTLVMAPPRYQNPTRRYDLDRLRRVTGLTWREFAERLGLSERHGKRLEDHPSMVTGTDADRYAVRLGYHPATVWPEWDIGRDVTLPSDTGA